MIENNVNTNKPTERMLEESYPVTKGFPICKLIEIYNEKYEIILPSAPEDRVFLYRRSYRSKERLKFYGSERLKGVKEQLNKPVKYMADAVCDSVFEFTADKVPRMILHFIMEAKRTLKFLINIAIYRERLSSKINIFINKHI